VIHLGIDLERFSVRGSHLAGDILHLFFVGCLASEKGLETFFHVLSELLRLWRLMVVGDGLDRVAFLRFVEMFGGSGRLYPALVGVLLRGAGFGVTTVDNTTYKTHTFKIAARDVAAWLSIMHRLGEGSDQFERKAKDARVSQLTLRAGRDGLDMDFEGMALSEAQSAGSETVTTDTNVPFMPNSGSLTLTVSATNIVAACKSNEMVIANPLSRDENFLFSFGNADLPQTGMSITGTIGDIDISYDLYKRLHWGGTSGTGIVNTPVEGALSYTYQSAVNISGAAVPYSLNVSVPTAMITMGQFQAQDDNLVRGALTWEMVDTGTEPITITLSNGQAAY
jgi:hypothetical protein